MPARAPSDLIDWAARGLRGYLLAGLAAILFGLPGFFSLPPLDRDESRFAQATAQMLETGDFVRIRLQDEPRNKKPIGIYWLQAASASAFGEPERRRIWPYRLPSLIGAAIAAMATFYAGALLIGRRAALVGALLLAATPLLSTEAMLAKTDAALTGIAALLLASLAHLRAHPDSRRAAFAFWVLMALGVLLKGPIAPMIAAFALAALWFWERDWRWAAALLRPAGPIAALALTLPWIAAITFATNGAFLYDWLGVDVGAKIVGASEHAPTPPGLHALAFLALGLPALVGLPAAIPAAIGTARAPRDAAEHAGARLLLAWAGPAWLAFELAPTKLAHYPLPLYPAVCLLCGAGFLASFAQHRWRRTGAVLFALGALGIGTAVAFMATLTPGDQAAAVRRAVQSAMVTGAFLAPVLLVLLSTRRPAFALIAVLCAAGALIFTARERIAPGASAWLVTRQITDAITREARVVRMPVLSVGYREPSLVFSLGTDTVLMEGAAAAERAVTGQIVVLESRQQQPFLEGLNARGRALTPLTRVAGRNYSNGDEVYLTIGRVADLAPPVSAATARKAAQQPPGEQAGRNGR